MRGFMLLAIVLAVLLVVFSLQNNISVTIKLFLWQLESPLGLVLLLSFAAGAVMAVLLTFPGAWRRNRSNSRQRRELEDLRAQLAESERKLVEMRNASGASRTTEDGRSANASDPASSILGLPPLV